MERRHRWRQWGAGLGVVLTVWAAALAVAAPKTGRPPNVVMILTDDQGSVDVGCYGSKDLQTPNLDRVAASGIRFTQFYASAPVCSPSRAGLLTGRYPWLAGLDGNAGNGPSEEIDDLRQATDDHGLRGREVTMAEMFKAAGYATAHIGKWHLGHGDGMRPLEQGFDYSFGHMSGCIDNYSHFMYWSGPNRHDLFENYHRIRLPGRFFPDLMVDRATRFMTEHRDSPFFIYFALNTPHYPYQGEPEWIEHYKNLPYPRRLYAAFISTLDVRIGKLLDAIEQLGLRNDTIVVYQSDHGHSTEQRAHGGGGSNGPYRGAKFSLFEGGIRVPAAISWPGHLPAGEVRGQLAHSCDWLPTVAELAGVGLPKSDLDGSSLVPILRDAGAPTPHDVVRWHLGRQEAVRQGPWKLIRNVNPTGGGPQLSKADKQWFLSNVVENPGETTNFTSAQPQVFNRLKAVLEKH